MSLLISLPEHIFSDIMSKMTHDSFSRTFRSNKSVHQSAIRNRRKIKIHLSKFVYEIATPSRRRQTVVLYRDDNKKMLFPKNFDTFLHKTISDFAFFIFDTVVWGCREDYPNTEDHREMIGQMLESMRLKGIRCRHLIHSVPDYLSQTVSVFKPKKLNVVCSTSVVDVLSADTIRTLNSLEFSPPSTGDVVRTIALVPSLCRYVSLWPYDLPTDQLGTKVLPAIKRHIQKSVEKITPAGQLDIALPATLDDSVKLMLKEVNEGELIELKKGTKMHLYSVRNLMFHCKTVEGENELKTFYDSVIIEEELTHDFQQYFNVQLFK